MNGTLTRITFEHGHGSTWGTQYYIDITQSEISEVRYFSRNERGLELKVENNIPISADRWLQIEKAALNISQSIAPLKKHPIRDALKRMLRSRHKAVDGREYRRLSLTFGDVVYNYLPDRNTVNELEALLKGLQELCEK
ncbi:MAG: hypothetical protein IJ519_02160 [Clostridia bacterium]|nr:hypothetical protein [Clostridia bacterium]